MQYPWSSPLGCDAFCTEDGMLDGPLVRAIIMNMGTAVYLMKGNAVLGRANRDKGRNYHRVVEAYAEALQKKE